MASPNIARLTTRFLRRTPLKLSSPSTPTLNQLPLQAKKNVLRKQLFTPPNNASVQIQSTRNLISENEAYLRNESCDVESPQNGYEVSTPLLQMLCEQRQPKDVKLLGRGTFGAVYFALKKGERVAIKVANKRCLKGEANALTLRHPNVATVFCLWSACGNIYHSVAIMQYAGSTNLHRVLLKQESLSTQAKASICVQVVQGLDYCHRRSIVHLDVKPANVLISTSTGVCKLSDFGCSVDIYRTPSQDSARMQCSKRCAIAGTVAYVAPELFHGHEPTAAADIYSLGILMHQLETQKIPFEGLHSHSIIYRVVSRKERPDIPSSPEQNKYWNVVEQCWNADPKLRPCASDIILRLTS